MALVRTLCGQCSVGCGIRAQTGRDRHVTVEGDRTHPANGGRLCDRGRALPDATALDGRLLHPLIGGRAATWDRAIAHVARQLSGILSRHGPGSIALHISGGLLTEDYYVANKLMKGFLASAHIQTSWIDTAAAQAAAFGEDVQPATFEDIDRAELVLMVGARIALDHPVLYQRIQAARATRGMRLILLATEEEGAAINADLRLAVHPDGATGLMNGLLRHCQDVGAIDAAFLARNVAVPDGFWDRLRHGHDIWSVARTCDLPVADIRRVQEQVAAAGRLVTLFSPRGGEQRHLAAAILNLHLATGRIGRPGAAPFVIADTANAMGGREVGCMASIVAAHRGFSDDALAATARFWGAPAMAAAAGLTDDALLQAMRDGRVKALWSIGGTPETSSWLRQAIALTPLAILSTDRLSSEMAGAVDIALPSPGWVEKDGTVTGADRLISRQRRLFALPGATRPDWWTVTRIAQAMGWRDAFPYERPAEIYREHARLTAYRNHGDRLFDLRRHAPISNPAYDELTPWRWGEVPFDDGLFPTPDRRARIIPSWDQPAAAIA